MSVGAVNQFRVLLVLSDGNERQSKIPDMIGKTRLVVSARYVFRPLSPINGGVFGDSGRIRLPATRSARRQNTDGSNCRRCILRSRTRAGAQPRPRNFPSGPNCRRNSLLGGDSALHHRLNAVRKRMIDQPAASALVALEDPIEPVHREVIPHQMGKVDIVVAILDPA